MVGSITVSSNAIVATQKLAASIQFSSQALLIVTPLLVSQPSGEASFVFHTAGQDTALYIDDFDTSESNMILSILIGILQNRATIQASLTST